MRERSKLWSKKEFILFQLSENIFREGSKLWSNKEFILLPPKTSPKLKLELSCWDFNNILHNLRVIKRKFGDQEVQSFFGRQVLLGLFGRPISFFWTRRHCLPMLTNFRWFPRYMKLFLLFILFWVLWGFYFVVIFSSSLSNLV